MAKRTKKTSNSAGSSCTTWLAKELQVVERCLVEELEKVRAKHRHSTVKGERLEYEIRKRLQEALGGRYFVGHGEIIDQRGVRSKESDIVIVGDESPVLERSTSGNLFIIETVRAVGEVKATLAAAEFEDTLTKAKHLATLDGGDGLRRELQGKFKGVPPVFLVAFQSRLSLAAIRKRMTKDDSVSAVFILGRGAIFRTWHIDARERKRRDLIVDELHGWSIIEGEFALLWLLIWLPSVMPQSTFVGVPPMTRYLDSCVVDLGQAKRGIGPGPR